MDEDVIDVSAGEEDAHEVEEKPKVVLSAAERLAAKKRARTQRRLSTMKNKVLRNAQWASLKKEKKKVNPNCAALISGTCCYIYKFSVGQKGSSSTEKKRSRSAG